MVKHFLEGKYFLRFEYDEDECPIYQHGQIRAVQDHFVFIHFGSWEDGEPVYDDNQFRDQIRPIMYFCEEHCYFYETVEELLATYEYLNCDSDDFSSKWEAKMKES